MGYFVFLIVIISLILQFIFIYFFKYMASKALNHLEISYNRKGLKAACETILFFLNLFFICFFLFFQYGIYHYKQYL